MKIIKLFIWVLLMVHSGVTKADQPVVLTHDKNTVVDLMDTDLVKKKDMLDCQLRLEGRAPHYKLVYSLGEIEVPTLAVKVNYDNSHMLLAVKAEISGIPVRKLFVRYHTEGLYRMDITCIQGELACDAPVAYELTATVPENKSLQILQSHYSKSLIVGRASSTNVNPRAIMIADRPGLFSGAMDGLEGANNKQETELHYVCGTK